jgi:hypothetical protein
MFIAGIAGIEKTAVTATSVTIVPSGCLTVTSIALSPDLGGSGSLLNAIDAPSDEAAPDEAAGSDAGGGADVS